MYSLKRVKKLLGKTLARDHRGNNIAKMKILVGKKLHKKCIVLKTKKSLVLSSDGRKAVAFIITTL